MDDDHGGVVVVDQRVEALVHQVLQGDRARDVRFQVDLSVLDELDRRGMIATLGNRAPQVDFLQDNFLHVDGGRMPPNRHINDDAGDKR
jgi:hypothetical protein